MTKGGADPATILLISSEASSESLAGKGLPVSGDNLFARIIGRPYPSGPRERACAEMLCALLRAAPTIREHILVALGELVGLPATLSLRDLVYEIETERGIPGGKRDDLRIEAWRDERRTRRALLWSVEVKVGAGFHYGPAVGSSDVEEAPVIVPVNQLLHYDGWLTNQIAESVEGFVIGCSRMDDAKPEGLRLRWPCETWTWMALKVEELGERALPAEERWLANHFCGFVRQFLWREEEAEAMGEQMRLALDDVALIRAFGAIGKDTQAKVNELLLGSVGDLLADEGLGLGPIQWNKGLFKPSARSICYASLFRRTGQAPYLCAGVATQRGTCLIVWLETTPTFKRKKEIREALTSLLGALNERAEARRLQWTLVEPNESEWWDLEVRLPLERLLGEENQALAASRFFADAFGDLKACKAMETIANAMGTQLEPPSPG